MEKNIKLNFFTHDDKLGNSGPKVIYDYFLTFFMTEENCQCVK